MARVKRGVTSHRKYTFRIATLAGDMAGQYQYRDRKVRKRTFRSLWIQRINAATREHGMTYGRFINGLSVAGIDVDRKVLSDLAIREPEAFKALVDQAAAALK